MKTVFFLLLPFIIVQCGSSKSPNQLSVREFSDKDEARSSFENSTISCSGADCPEFSGGLYSFTSDYLSYNVGSCSVTLISSDRVLTNRHCVPSGLRYKGASCNDRIKVYFPATLGLPAERLECSKIEMISASNETSGPDWAIIKLKTGTSRKPVNLNRKGISEDSVVNIYKVNFDLFLDKPSRGEIVKTKCIANSNHVFARNFIGPQSALTNVSDCDNTVIQGNSGSGILNESSELVGVLSFTYSVEEESSSLAKKYSGIKQTSGGGTNLACMKFDSFEPSSLCEFSSSREYGIFAEIYAVLKAQRSDETFNNEINPTPLWKNDLIEMMDMNSKALENFDLRMYGSMKDVKKLIANDVLETLFFKIPKCVAKNAPNTFKFNMWVRDTRGDDKLDNQFFRTVETRLKEVSVRATSVGSSSYELKFYDVVGVESGRYIFNLNPGSPLKYEVPVCDI